MANEPRNYEKKWPLSRLATITLISAFIVVSPGVEGQGICFAREPFKGTEVGEWAEYRITTREGESFTMRRSVVGKEGSMLWLETRTDRSTGATIMKVLIDPATGQARRAIVKTPPEPAIELPLSMADKMTKAPVEKVIGKAEAVITQETITTPAGTFKCSHVREVQSPPTYGIWSCERVPLGGLVQSRLEGHTLVLTAFGSRGAKSEITEIPQKMPSLEDLMKRGTGRPEGHSREED